jgi:O-antigen/teichoic acid export membrane protein
VLPSFVTLLSIGDERRLQRYLGQILPVAVLLWAAACCVLAWVGTAALPLVFGAGFAHVGALIWPLMAAAALGGPTLLGYGPLSNARSATTMSMIAGVLGAVTNLGLNVLLIPTFGMSGCAWATLGTAGATSATWMFLSYRRFGVRPGWVPVAVAPPLVGALVNVSGSPVTAFAAAMAVIGIVGVWHRREIRTAIQSGCATWAGPAPVVGRAS